ncbi:hypothetical protein EVAR_16023_1 [Eumeta japonica]|uniref:Tesmin/TSO1-like CXC domain-containing protein n=1 Tax=Eumeta variegata TaxID=151549 RepID=A0A4C1VYX6_EUMVA|nr:hypothetical protein EVAR_16023_1 [Eumeta japonica]
MENLEFEVQAFQTKIRRMSEGYWISLRYKQFAKAVTKSTFNLSSLPPTQDTARFHTFRVYHQVQSWLGNYNDPEDWGWKKCGKLLMPVQNSKPPAPPELLKLIFCKCKGNCGAMCGCRKAGMKCSAVCFHCSGETCSNVIELSELINENDFDDEPPTLTPFLLQFSHWYLIQKPDQMLSRSLVHRND